MPSPGPSHPPLFSHLREKILVVDDDEMSLRIVAHVFKLNGHRCLLASSGQQALQIFQQERPGLVVVDIHMPEMDGFVLCERLRGLEPNRSRLFIAALTGDTAETTTARALRCGMDTCLHKPCSQVAMAALVEQAERHLRTAR